jgi:hypothetical protein
LQREKIALWVPSNALDIRRESPLPLPEVAHAELDFPSLPVRCAG